MKELTPIEAANIDGGDDTFAYDAGRYVGGYAVGFLLGGAIFPTGPLLGTFLGIRQMLQ